MEEPNQPAPESPFSGKFAVLEGLRDELAIACRLLLRFPVPWLDSALETGAGESDALRRRGHRAFPLAGFLVGFVLAVVWSLAWSISHNAWLASAFCVAASVFLTGALHEDGLADSADLLGVPPPREAAKIQAVLDDPHHGTYGVTALVLSLVLRVVLLASFASGIVSAFVLLLVSETLSRAAAGFALCYRSGSFGSEISVGQEDVRKDTGKDTVEDTPEAKATGLAAGWRPIGDEAAPEFVLLLAVVLVCSVSLLGSGSLRVAVSAFVFAALVGGLVWHGLRRLHSPALSREDGGDSATVPAGVLAGDGLGALQQAVLIASLFGAAIAL